MSNALKHLASDLGTTRLLLRQDLRFTACDDPGDPHVIIEDPLTGNYFRLGKIEFAFICRLSVDSSLSEVLPDLCGQNYEYHFSEEDAAELCRWLVNNELAHTDSSRSVQRMNRTSRLAAANEIKGRINPIAIKIPLLQPDRMVERMTRWLGWFFSIQGTVACIILMLIAGALAICNAKELSQTSLQLFSPSTMIGLMAISVILKIVHEFSHAIVCKRYGGNIGEMGLMLVLFAPLAYIDVSSVWRFRNRWQRVHVAIAGMLVELTIAAAAMIVWQLWPSPLGRYLCVNIMMAAGLMTILFNANPLMKFDGYYALTDWMRSPNLYADGQRHLARLGRRCFFGISDSIPDWSVGYRNLVRIYAWLCFAWKWFVCAGLLVAASKLFQGLGIILAVAGMIAWLVGPSQRLAKQILTAAPHQLLRFCTMIAAIGTAAVSVMVFIPWPGSIKVPAVVEYAMHEVIRAEVSGFVDVVHVRSGQAVVAGDVLLSLKNPEMQFDSLQLEIRIAQSTVRQRQLTLQRQHAAAQAEAAVIQSLTDQHDELLRQIDRLNVRASSSGIVVRRRLDELVGTFVTKGDSLAVIGDESRKELRVQIPESHFDRFRERVGTTLRFRTAATAVQATMLSKVNPRASTSTEYSSLYVSNGGPLPVRPTSGGDTNAPEYELLAVHFEAVALLDPLQSEALRCGQLASVTLANADHSIGEHCWEVLNRWVH